MADATNLVTQKKQALWLIPGALYGLKPVNTDQSSPTWERDEMKRRLTLQSTSSGAAIFDCEGKIALHPTSAVGYVV